jgi:hypothetical protein
MLVFGGFWLDFDWSSVFVSNQFCVRSQFVWSRKASANRQFAVSLQRGAAGRGEERGRG